MKSETPWQIKMFSKSLKKQLKLKALSRHVGQLPETAQCLLVTCGDNNGATNYLIRNLGGQWTWADMEQDNISEMEDLLGDKVHLINKENPQLPFTDGQFDLVVSIDVHEHLEDIVPVTKEFTRVLKDSGRIIITTPNGNEKKLAVRIKNAVGMTKEAYGHVRVGLDIPDIVELMKNVDVTPYKTSSYSKFFTESLELIINFLYVKVLARKSKAKVEQGTIAPTSKDQLKSIQKSYKLYAMIYPFFWTISKLDLLLFFTRGYAVVVEGKK